MIRTRLAVSALILLFVLAFMATVATTPVPTVAQDQAIPVVPEPLDLIGNLTTQIDPDDPLMKELEADARRRGVKRD